MSRWRLFSCADGGAGHSGVDVVVRSPFLLTRGERGPHRTLVQNQSHSPAQDRTAFQVPVRTPHKLKLFQASGFL